MSSPDAPVSADEQKNPYVGPRAFKRGEPLPARERETSELANLLIAERIVLLHSPSGAGKTSLINAGLSPHLRRGRFRPSSPLRVNAPALEDVEPHNRYVYSVAIHLLGKDMPPKELASLKLPEIIERAAAKDREGYFVLVLDQFEEILLIDPADQENQRIFFRELGEALSDGKVWALLSMREDYMGGLDRYLRYLPGHLATRYRLDFLDREAAAVAIRMPARHQGVEFTDEAVAKLVERLATAKKLGAGGEEIEVPAPYVQPVQLQVVCRKLWKAVSDKKHAEGQPFGTIEVDDVADPKIVSAALSSYYASAVKHVAKETGADEKVIRRWFESELITPEGHRSQTLTGPVSGEIEPPRVTAALENSYLIRGDSRGDATWYEIAHDRLVTPIQADNGRWMRRHLKPWQLAARNWGSDDASPLIGGHELRAAQRQAEKAPPIDIERRFLEASLRADRQRGLLARAHRRVTLIQFVVVIQSVVIVVLIFGQLTE